MRFLVGFICALFFAASIVSPAEALPPRCRAASLGRICLVGIASSSADVAADPQHASEWCWAATAEMIFRTHGFPITQEAIVRDVYGSLANMPANPTAVARLLTHVYTASDGRRFRVRSRNLSYATGAIARELADGRPLFLATSRHAMMLTAMAYAARPDGTLTPLEAVVRDPWPRPGWKRARERRVLSRRELRSIVRVLAVDVE